MNRFAALGKSSHIRSRSASDRSTAGPDCIPWSRSGSGATAECADLLRTCADLRVGHQTTRAQTARTIGAHNRARTKANT